MDAKTIRSWGQIVSGSEALLLLLAALIVAVILKEHDLIMLIGGVIAANATNVINFFFGSSSGSQSKDETIANSYPAGVAPPAVPAAPPQGAPNPNPPHA